MLIELIQWLEKQDPELVVPHGFGEPDSYRGDFSEVAFTPEDNVSFGDMLACAKAALGATFEGYKGGEFTMDEYTECYIAKWGTWKGADRIGNTMLKLWKATAR